MAIKARAQQTLTKIFDGSGIFSIILTNENTSIPVSDQGIALNYSATPTDVYVYSGTSLLTPVASNPGPGQYTLTASGENITAGIVSVLSDHAAIGPATDYVTGKQSYSITVQASGQDFLGNPFSSQKKQVIIPLKKGDDATSYWVTSSSSVITKDTKNVITPSSTTVSALYQTGMADPVAYKGIFKVYLKTGTDFSMTPDYTSQNPESGYTIMPRTSVNDIKVELYDVTGTNLLDVQTIPVISQANGVIKTSIVYTVTSTTTQPDDSAAWSNTIPSVGKGQYLWTRTTFYYTDGSNAVGYSMGANGKDGSSAPLLTLSSDSQIVTFDSDNITPLPSSQTVTLVANLQNVTGTATFTATPYAGTTAGSPITLGGSGNSRTLSVSQFGTSYDSIVVKATLGALTDTETIHKLSKGENGDPGPKGADGKNGSDGAQGPKGADGRTSYVHVAYSNSADGKIDFSTTVSTGKTYVGVFTDFTSTDSTNPADYTWSLIKGSDGKDGSDGIQGPKGADGISTYVHFAYANSSDGKTNFSVTDPTGRAYVGTLTDTTVADSTDPTKYTWSLIKGADGTDGKNGVNSYSGWLTNESITLQADSNGNVPSFTSATGSFVVYNGLTQVTGLTVTQANASGITVSITGMNYSVTGMSSDNGYVDLSITTSGITIIKRLTVSKSKAGATGANGTSVVNSTTPPSNPAEGQWWNDLSVTPNILKVYQKGSWIPYRIDAINLVAGSVKTDNLAADVLLASNVKYTNSNGTTTNLQTFDFDGIKTLLSDNNGNTYSSMDNAVSSTQSWTSLSRQVNSLGQINQLFNTEFSPDFAGWNIGTPNISGKFTTTTPLSSDTSWSLSSEKFNGSNVLLNTYGSGASSINSGLIPIGGNVLSIVALQAYSSSNYNGTVTASLRFYYYDSNQNYISSALKDSSKISSWTRLTASSTSPSNAAYVVVAFVTNGSVGTSSYSQPMLVFSGSIGDYVQGNYNNNARVLAIETSANQFQVKISGDVKTAQDSADSANNAINNLSVGGTNLVSGTNQEYQMGYGIPKTTWQDGYAYLKLPINVISGEILPQSPHTFSYTLVQGTTYTQTIWFETNATVKDLSVAQITWFTNAGHDVQPAIIQKLGQNSYKIVSTYTWPGKTDNNVRLFDIEHLDSAFDLSTGTYLKFGKLKLEKGNLPTDWTPAPEDVQSGITSAQTSANTANTNAGKAQSAADTANTNAGKAQESANTANQSLANASQSGIRYLRFRGEGNTDNQASHFGNISVFNTVGTDILSGKTATTVGNPTISGNGLGAATDGKYNTTYTGIEYNATNHEQYIMFDLGSLRYDVNKIEIGMWSTTRTYYGVKAQSSTDGNTWQTIYVGNITPNQLVGNSTVGQVVGTTISFGMDTSTVLKLTADNYTLGIDSNGNLISGITGNTKSVTIKGNAITLDGNTNVTGDFYALGGNFKNLNAANLVGTNASFFQANFSNAYGQFVSLDGSGMVVSYSDRFTTFDGDGVKYKQLVNYSDGTSGIETIGSFITSYKGTVNSLMMNVYDQTYNNIGSPAGEIWGGDMLGWSRAADHNGNLNSLFTWSNGTAASNMGTSFGFNFYDRINFNQNEIVSGGSFNFLMSSTKFGNGYFGGKSVPSITATWSGNTGGGIAFGNDNVIIFAPGKTKIIL